MEASEVLEGLIGRVEALELTVGDVDGLADDWLIKKVASVVLKLREVLRDGRGYSEELWQLLELFSAGDHRRDEEHLEKLHTVLGRFDEIRESLRELQRLDVACSDLARRDMAARVAVVEIYGLVQLPRLVDTCNRLLVRSLSLVQRFITWNEQYNEFYSELEGRLKRMEDEIDFTQL